MRYLLIFMLLVSCATVPKVEITVTEDSTTVTGNAPGREITYEETEAGVTVTVKDARVPVPFKGTWDKIWGVLEGLGGRIAGQATIPVSN